MGDSVKVAVRVRPFNSREKAEGAELCVKMTGNTTKVWSKEAGIEKEFNFDYSYWSHDGFAEDPATGMLKKSTPTSIYADQQTVFNDLGVEVLDNAWNGYNVCLFAYGQTGSGKSYSIVGYGANKGIIPIACEEIFSRIKLPQAKKIDYQVEVSMLEIYNEQVQDLLTPPSAREKGGLKVRENPKTGVYVEGLKKMTVSSYAEISAVLDKGNEHRTVGATQMNATSSRAHTVLTISFTQLFYDESTGKPLNRKQSDINLVDLAGSERAGKTGATGDRLAEGSNINKSLSCLGKVITALAKKSAPGGKGEVVPYRESKLTRILQNALGGNSKTTMIAAISPATFNFEETLSTLRYADQVKAIKNKAVVNETPQEKLIRELREENERLKALVEGRGGGGGGGGIDEESLQEYQSQIEMLRRAKEQAEMTFQQRLEEMEKNKTNTIAKVEVSGPHLSNLNEDAMLNGQIKHKLEGGVNVIGKGGSSGIIINGLGVGPEHCKISFDNGNFTIQPSSDPSLKTMVNGVVLKSPVQLQNQDRIRFGNHVYFSFIHPDFPSNPQLDWEYAVKEANETEMKSLMGEKEAEMRQKEEEMQKKMQEEIQKAYQKMDEEKKQLELLLNSKNKEDEASKIAMAQREKELIERQRQMEEELQRKEQELKEREKERVAQGKVDKMISGSLQLSNEANERAGMLNKPIRFKPEFYRVPNEDGTVGKGSDSLKMRLKLIHPALGDTKLFWPTEKLEERVADMADMCEQYFNGTPLDKIDVGYDPFSIDPDEIENFLDNGGFVGMINILTKPLWYLMDVDEETYNIYNSSGNDIGKLVASIQIKIPGEDIEEAGYEDMNQVQGKECILTVNIKSAIGLGNEISKDVNCVYTIPALGREVFRTNKIDSNNPVFNYSKEHKFIVTSYVSNEIDKGLVPINLFGYKSDAIKYETINKVKKALGFPTAPAPKQDAPALPSNPKNQVSINNSKEEFKAQPHSEEFKSSPLPLSQSILDRSSEDKNKSTAIVAPTSNLPDNNSSIIVASNEEAQAKIRELDAKLKLLEEQRGSKKSGCCEVF
jgi:kinesin family member 13